MLLFMSNDDVALSIGPSVRLVINLSGSMWWIKKTQAPKSNLSRYKRFTLKILKEDNTRIILSEDKKNATVIMRRKQEKVTVKHPTTPHRIPMRK